MPKPTMTFEEWSDSGLPGNYVDENGSIWKPLGRGPPGFYDLCCKKNPTPEETAQIHSVLKRMQGELN